MKAAIMKMRKINRENDEVSMRDKPIKTMHSGKWTARINLVLVFTIAIFMCQSWYGATPVHADTVTKTFTFDTTSESWAGLGGGSTTDAYNGAAGNPAGSLNTTVAGRNKTNTASGWSISTTWESLGIPAGATITSVDGSYHWNCSSFTDGTGDSGALVLDNGAGANAATLETGVAIAGTSAWASRNATGIVAVPAALQASNSAIRFLLSGTLGTINSNNGATITRGKDNISIVITYTPLVLTPPSVVSGPVASNTESGTYLDSPFDLTARFNDNGSAVSLCQYSLNNGGSWSAAVKSGSGAATDCNASPACTNGTAMTILMRATNGGGTTSTGTLSRTCDAAGPASGASFAATPGNTTCTLNWAATTDAGSGMNATQPYEVRWQLGSDPGNCTGGAQLYTGTGTSTPHSSLTNGNTYYYRLCYKDVFNYQSEYAGNPVACIPVSGPPSLNPDGITGGTWTNEAGAALTPDRISDVNDATYAKTSANGATFDASFSNDAAYAGKQIDNVRIYVRASSTGEKIDWGPYIGTTAYLSGTPVTLTALATPEEFFKDWAANPATGGNWTPAEVDALVVRFSMVATGGPSEERVYKAWTIVTYSDPPSSGALLHNSATTSSSKWGGWGVAGKRYGAITCDTCHTDGTANIKKVKNTIITAPNTPTNRFPAEIGGVAPSFTRISGTPGTAGVMGDDSVNPRSNSSRICEICHTYDGTGANGTKYHAYSGGINDPAHANNAADCTGCHKHSEGFKAPACDTCHGNPPTAASAGGPTGLANSPNTTGSTTPGSHGTHAVTLGYACTNCHNNQNMPQTSTAKPGFGDISISFSNFGSTTGSYSGQSSVSYNNTLGTGTMTCSTVYCHSAGQNSTGGALTAGDYGSPQWGTPATGACGTCHKVTEAAGLTSGSHGAHLGAGGVNGCGDCHTGAANDGSSYASANHVNRLIEATGAYTMGGTPGNGYGTCSTAACHANVYGTGTVTTPTWGAVSDCTACHTVAIASTGPNTGSHVKHNDSTCTNCHNAGTTQTTSPTTGHADGNIDVTNGYPLNVTKHAAGTYTGTCSTASCHANVYGAGTVATPVWGTASGCTACHSVAIATSGPNTGSHAKHNVTDCSQCHSGATNNTTTPTLNHADGNIDVTNGYPLNVTKHASGTYTGTCSTAACHANVYGAGTVATPVWGAASGCTACHSVAIATSGPNTGSHAKHNVTDCSQCHAGATNNTTTPTLNHADGNIDVTNGYPLNVTKHASGSYTGTCSTASCHVNVYGAGTIATPVWGTASGCTACHTVAIATTGPNTGSHAMHATTFAACTDCHNAGTTQTTVPSTAHIDGNIDVIGGYPLNVVKHAAGSYTGTCANKCHGSNSGTWGANTTAATCVKCHGVVGSTSANYTADPKRAAPGYTAAAAPTGPGVDTAGQSANTDAEAGAHDAHLRSIMNISSDIACNECHVVPAQVQDAGHFDTYPGATMTFGTLARTGGLNPTTAGSPVTCTNTYCHAKTGFAGTDTTPAWNQSTYLPATMNAAGCGMCHAYPPAGHDAGDCNGCHTHVNAGAFTFNDPTLHINGAVDSSGGDCLGCHAAIKNDAANADIDSDGVRAVVAEFTRNSHHVYNKTLTKYDCSVCHAEGDYLTGNTTTSHKNGRIDLRLVDGTTSVIWTGTEHGNIDSHCLSCHDANGASTTFSRDPAKPGTAANPFGGTVSNAYDTIVRPTVMNVNAQFATANASHHAVLGQRYTTTPASSLFANNRFIASYTPLGAAASVRDTSIMHCGDCHTVGVWKTTGGIGAHGSANEYMLRTTSSAGQTGSGTDVEHTATTYVCFNCHGNTINYSANHAGGNNSDFAHTSTSAGTTRASGDGNITGMTCANCHNSGATGWGGIHGGNTNYTDISSISQRPYRFMPGMGNTRYAPGDWTATSATGCYTGPTANWGSCTKHGSGAKAATRNQARPLTY